MLRFSIACVFCLSILVCGAPASKAVVVSGSSSSSDGASKSKNTSSTEKRQVVNIILDKMDSNYIYAKDGKKYQIRSSTKIIRNITAVSNTRIAELVFVSGDLTTITIK
ncbi:MAG: hypothetical protein LLG06_12040 [Desulfobacteraceae bacterium]|nr:hypothetical protein [Desulfobacteraceae bacterium]